MIKLRSLLTEDTFADSDLVPVKQIPHTLYHATFEELVNSIMKHGLLPAKNAIQNFQETDKRFVYLATTARTAHGIISDLYSTSNSPRLKRLSGKINVLTINTTGLNKKKFFQDPYSGIFNATFGGDAIMYMDKIPTKNIIGWGD